MDTPFHRKPIPAVGIAIAAGIVASKASTNAAKAIGLPTLIFNALLGLFLILFGFSAR